MKQIILYCDYFKKTLCIWILLIICVYCIFACEFESLRFKIFSINENILIVNKINDIIKNFSFSYVAGVIFFFLSDTIPFLRRKSIVDKNIRRSLNLMINAIDQFTLSINNKKWTKATDVKKIYEDISGAEYSENLSDYKLPFNKVVDIVTLSKNINLSLDYIISQELYVDIELLNEMEKIKFCDSLLYISSLSIAEKDETFINPKKLIMIFSDIINFQSIISKHL